MIDWQKVAQQNNLTTDEFTIELLQAVAALGVMQIDEKSANDTLKFKTSDNHGKIEVYIRRVND
tara:strand:+ start:130 stop:321 length:192 start_codon:yes stop_codon:yes gene_type:complete